MADDIIDLPDILERVQDDKALLLELLDIFQEDFAGERRALGEAVTKKDFNKIRKGAHALKGASGNISAKRMSATCLQLEQLAKANTIAGMSDLVKTIDSQFEEVKANIEKLKKEFAG